MRWPQFFSLLSANANTLKPAPVAPSSVHLPKWPQPKMTTPLVPSPTGLKPAEASGEPSAARTSAISNDGCDRDADITWTPPPDYKAMPRLLRQGLHSREEESRLCQRLCRNHRWILRMSSPHWALRMLPPASNRWPRQPGEIGRAH